MSLKDMFEWQPDVQPDRKMKPISPTQMRALGLPKDLPGIVDDLEELTKNPPNIIIAQSLSQIISQIFHLFFDEMLHLILLRQFELITGDE